MRPAAGEAFSLAGIWDRWEGKLGEVIESVTIITTSANELMQPIHNRMPVVIEKDDLVEWLAPQTELKLALAMLGPYPSEKMVAYPVNSVVNNAGYDGPECVAKVNVYEPPY